MKWLVLASLLLALVASCGGKRERARRAPVEIEWPADAGAGQGQGPAVTE